MNSGGPFEIIILWAHAMAAIAWIGGSLFYAAALNPAMDEVGSTPERWSLVVVANREFREVVKLAILVFVISGAILTFSRLSLPRVSTAYVAVLALKLTLSLTMFWLASRLGGRPGQSSARRSSTKRLPWWLRPHYAILELGAVVTLLSQVLRVLYEQSLVSST